MSEQRTINFNHYLENDTYAALTKKLHELAGDKAKTYIARALNKTATSARVVLADKAKESYTVKVSGFRQDMRVSNASSDTLTATIRSHGNTLGIKKFRYTAPKSGVRVDIVKTGLKPLTKYGNKAFVGRGKLNGEVYVRKSAERFPIEKLKSKSTPYMIGSDNRVYGVLRPDIEDNLKKYMNQQIALLMGQRGGGTDAE